MKVVLVTGGFDPLHSGHIEYFRAARQLGDILIVGINSDAWLERKKGRAFMSFEERHAIVSSLTVVDYAINFADDDNSALDAIRKIKAEYAHAEIIFANGGDRTANNIPEMVFDDVEFVFGVGGTDKANSSSWILEEWKAPKTERAWGYYRVLKEYGNHVKLKELTVEPGERLSMQRHEKRAEHWFVAQGTATVYSIDSSTDVELLGTYEQFDHVHIRRTQWHQLCNETTRSLKLIEIQYGEDCVEEDIERRQ